MGKKKELRELHAQTEAILARANDLRNENDAKIASLLNEVESAFSSRLEEANQHIRELGEKRSELEEKFSAEIRDFNDAALAFHAELDDLLGGFVHEQ